MNIFVRSRGIKSTDEYTWVEVKKTTQDKRDDFPNLFQDESTNLIYSEKPSVVLSRRDDDNDKNNNNDKIVKSKLLLLITAIQPEGRGDNFRRQIRISVGWIGENSPENEDAFRLLAARALDDKENSQLTREIAEAVSLDGIHGFKADYQKLLALISSCQIDHKVDRKLLTEQEEKFNKLAQISDETKQSLVQMLRQCKLPKREGVLVIYTTNKAERTLKQAQVWRGISSHVKSPYWQVYSPHNTIIRNN